MERPARGLLGTAIAGCWSGASMRASRVGRGSSWANVRRLARGNSRGRGQTYFRLSGATRNKPPLAEAGPSGTRLR